MQETFSAIWTNPASIDPRARSAEVSRGIAKRLADVSKWLEGTQRLRTIDATDSARSLAIEETALFLMDGVRGRNKAPGEYRQIPNWIGPEGCTMEQARFVPVGADALPAAMAEWENYIHADAPDRLVQLAIAHAEFEAIHPFLDGNGRLGRLFIPLFLYAHGLLSRPNFCLSEYLEANRDEYYDRLLAISSQGDWTGWVAFFLRGVMAQAEANTAKARAILQLHEQKRDWVVNVARSQYAVRALDWIFVRPIFSPPDLLATADIPPQTARNILRAFRSNGMLKELARASGRSPAVLAFVDLLNIADPSPLRIRKPKEIRHITVSSGRL